MNFTLSSPYLTDFLSFGQDRSSLFMALKSQRTYLDFVVGTGPLRNSKGFRLTNNHDRISSATQILSPFSCSGDDIQLPESST